MMAFGVQPRGSGRGRGREDATAKELRELRERIVVMERRGVRPEETSDEEEPIDETDP